MKWNRPASSLLGDPTKSEPTCWYPNGPHPYHALYANRLSRVHLPEEWNHSNVFPRLGITDWTCHIESPSLFGRTRPLGTKREERSFSAGNEWQCESRQLIWDTCQITFPTPIHRHSLRSQSSHLPSGTATLVGTDRRKPRATPTDITFRVLKAEWSPNDITCLLDVLKLTYLPQHTTSIVTSTLPNRVVNPSTRVHLPNSSGLLGICGGSPDHSLQPFGASPCLPLCLLFLTLTPCPVSNPRLALNTAHFYKQKASWKGKTNNSSSPPSSLMT